MTAIEQASERAGVSTDALMENAGLAVARAARDELGGSAGARIVVLVGPGNNGADGLVAARHLRRWAAEVTCCLLTRRPECDPKQDLARQYGVEIAANPDDETLKRLVSRSQMVIDAVLGTGRSRPLAGPVGDAMLLLQRSREFPKAPTLLALDLPTGLNADTGEVDPACPHFDTTLALGYPKAGLLCFPGAERAGRLRVLDIGVPPGLPEERSVEVEMLTLPVGCGSSAVPFPRLPQGDLRTRAGGGRLAPLRRRSLAGVAGIGAHRGRADDPGQPRKRLSHRCGQRRRGHPPAAA